MASPGLDQAQVGEPDGEPGHLVLGGPRATDDDSMMWGERFTHVSERWPDKRGIHLQTTCFDVYQIADNLWVPFLVTTTTGVLWTCERHPDNKRGDAATKLQRKERIRVCMSACAHVVEPWTLDELISRCVCASILAGRSAYAAYVHHAHCHGYFHLQSVPTV
jgi:hypothetical protein